MLLGEVTLHMSRLSCVAKIVGETMWQKGNAIYVGLKLSLVSKTSAQDGWAVVHMHAV